MCLLRRLVSIFAVLIGQSVTWAAEPAIRIQRNPTSVELINLSAEQLAPLAMLPSDDPAWHKTLAVYIADEELTDPPAVGGTYTIEMGAVRFTPRYEPRPGARYRVVARPLIAAGSSAAGLVMELVKPLPPPTKATEVTAIYPSSRDLPDNQLRFYLHFSAPMSAGEAYQHVKLLKADGTEVKRAFLEIGEELWDGTGQRLTLLFDPGRVKRGLKPREEFGPVLEAGQSYRLVVDRGWHDANGQPLAADFEKQFTARPVVETAVDYKQWKVVPPSAGSRDRLLVQFDRPLDRALLMRMIEVVAAGDKPLAGEITVSDEERRWEFRPNQPWKSGEHTLVVDTTLEDSAGNNLARPFEVDVFERVDDKTAPDVVRIPFVVRAK